MRVNCSDLSFRSEPTYVCKVIHTYVGICSLRCTNYVVSTTRNNYRCTWGTTRGRTKDCAQRCGGGGSTRLSYLFVALVGSIVEAGMVFFILSCVERKRPTHSPSHVFTREGERWRGGQTRSTENPPWLSCTYLVARSAAKFTLDAADLVHSVNTHECR